MIVVIFSIGQFIGSDLTTLKMGFQNWFAADKREISGDTVWNWMSQNLKPLRVNAITLEQFCEQFNAQFNSGYNVPQMPYATFEAIFKSMATIDAASIEAISQFGQYLTKNNGAVKCLLVSHTNVCQFEHILSQLPPIPYKVVDDKVAALPKENMLFVTSMNSQAEMHPQSFAYALEKLKLGIDDSDITYVSFLNTIPSSELIEYVNPYIGAEKKLNIPHVVDLIDQQKLNKAVSTCNNDVPSKSPSNSLSCSFLMALLSHPATPIMGAILFLAGVALIATGVGIGIGIGMAATGAILAAGYAATKFGFFTNKSDVTTPEDTASTNTIAPI